MGAHELLTFTELETALLEAAALVNKRPLTVRLYEDDAFYPVSPSDLLLGRIAGFLGAQREEVELEWPSRVEKIERFVAAWWKRWEAAAFQLFTPRSKWTQKVRPLAEGDIVLLQADTKIKQGDYGLGVVSGAQPGQDGQVRTVLVRLWNRRKRRGTPDTREIPMGVQRLAVLLPVEEKWLGGAAIQES